MFFDLTTTTGTTPAKKSRRVRKKHKQRSSVLNTPTVTEECSTRGNFSEAKHGDSTATMTCNSSHCSSSNNISEQQQQQQILLPFSQWLYENLFIAEKNSEIRLIRDLMRIVDQQDECQRAAILSKRHKSLLNHPWIHYQIRAEEAEKLNKYAAEIRNQHSPIINDRGDSDLDLDVYYNANIANNTMEFILDANLRGLNIMSVSSLISEVEQYTKWMPVVGYALKEQPKEYDEGYYCHVQFNSPLPFIVKNRDIAMHLKCDSDFRNPVVPDAFSDVVYPHLRQPNNTFHIWTESMGYDPLLMNSKKMDDDNTYLLPPQGAPDPYKARDRCQRIFLHHGVGNIQLLESNGRPSLKISMIISVDIGIITPPEWLVKFVGATIFKGIIREIMKNAKDIQRVKKGKKTKWKYAQDFAELIKVNVIYRFLRRAIPKHLHSHLM